MLAVGIQKQTHWDKMKRVVILSPVGRSGTTMYQEMLCKQFALTSAKENINIAGTYNEYVDSLKTISDMNTYVVKYFYNLNICRWYSVDDFYLLKPDKIVHLIREDLFDHFLSCVVSKKNGIWNDTVKRQYDTVELKNHPEWIDGFLKQVSDANLFVESLLEEGFDVETISYETLLETYSIELGDVSVVKQNTKIEKQNLISNIDDVIDYWNSVSK